MKKATVGQEIVCDGYKGVVESVRDNGQVMVLLHGTDGWPFPTRRLVAVKDLSRRAKEKKVDDVEYEEAPF